MCRLIGVCRSDLLRMSLFCDRYLKFRLIFPLNSLIRMCSRHFEVVKLYEACRKKLFRMLQCIDKIQFELIIERIIILKDLKYG